MEITVWLAEKMVIYIGGDPAKGTAPTVTIEADKPQILISQKHNSISIVETK